MAQDALYALALRLPLKELQNFCRTDRRRARITKDPYFWRLRALSDFSVELPPSRDLDWLKRRYFLIRRATVHRHFQMMMIGIRTYSEEKRRDFARFLFSDRSSAVASVSILRRMAIDALVVDENAEFALDLLERYAEQMARLPISLRADYRLVQHPYYSQSERANSVKLLETLAARKPTNEALQRLLEEWAMASRDVPR